MDPDPSAFHRELALLIVAGGVLGSNWWNVFSIVGTPAAFWESVGEFPDAGMEPVTAAYFDTLKMTRRQRPVFQPVGHARLAAGRDRQQQRRRTLKPH